MEPQYNNYALTINIDCIYFNDVLHITHCNTDLIYIPYQKSNKHTSVVVYACTQK